MKHTLFTVLATTALTLSGPAFAATQHERSNNAAEQKGAIQHEPGGNGSATNPNGSSKGSSEEMNRENCVPRDQAGMSAGKQARAQSKDEAACPPGTAGEHGGALHNGSPSGSSRHNGNFDKDK